MPALSYKTIGELQEEINKDIARYDKLDKKKAYQKVSL